MKHRLCYILLLLALSRAGETCGQADPARAEPVSFHGEVRPILADNCFPCHGPDKGKRKASLRLDTQAGLFSERQGKTPVVPGKPAASELFRRVTTADAEDRMPPLPSGKTLTPAQVAVLERWIEQSAPWEDHWAYVAPKRPAIPKVQAAGASRNPIDRFVRARLEQAGLSPAPEADRRTLIRRLSYDLTGLGPSPAEVHAFEQDRSAKPYEKLVERLLASPHFGERLAMFWLDVVRYADTDGFHADNYRSVYPYRDYVIRAFNQNLPFDRFTVEQLAGDLLPNATVPQRVASTYNRLGRSTEEGGAQPQEYLAKYAADRVRATATTWLGSTMGCAECHDHKYDPFTTRDFYRFAAYFADIKEQGVGVRESSLVPGEPQERELAQLEARIAALERQVATPTARLARAQARWEGELQAALEAGQLGWHAVKPATAVSQGGATLTVLDDLSVLASGQNPVKDTYQVTLTNCPAHMTGVRLEVLTHPSLDKASLSRGGGNFVLTEVVMETTPGGGSKAEPLKIASVAADFSQPGHPVSATIDGKADTGWAVAGHEKAQDHKAAFTLAKAIPGSAGATLTIQLKHESSFERHSIGRFRLSLITLEQPGLEDEGMAKEVVEALRTTPAQRTPQQLEAVRKRFQAVGPELAAMRGQLEDARQQKEALLKSIPRSLATVAVEPRVTRILPRGDWMREDGEVVTPAPPEFLDAPSEGSRRQTRLDLARWLVARDNPLTARVFVNRLWRLFYGAGLARSLDDAGTRGPWPSHPELLDWLAVEFIDSGWDVKHIVRLMVTSSTYRQSSQADEATQQRDPANRLLARQARFRLEAEMVRDHVLAVSGLLEGSVGGPSVKPYQPAGYWDQLNFPKRTWEHDHRTALYRRGLYTFWCRTFLHPSLAAFDACPREEASVERAPSNTPLQALALLNDPSYVEAARVFAERILQRGGRRFDRRLRFAFDQALARKPDPREVAVLGDLFRKQLDLHQREPDNARHLVKVGERPMATGLDPVELAAWTEIARTLLNLHESITRP